MEEAEVTKARKDFVELCEEHIKSCELQLSGNPDIDSRWIVGTGKDPVWVSFHPQPSGRHTLDLTTRSLFKVHQFKDVHVAHRVAKTVLNGRGEYGVAYRYREALELSLKLYTANRDSVLAHFDATVIPA